MGKKGKLPREWGRERSKLAEKKLEFLTSAQVGILTELRPGLSD